MQVYNPATNQTAEVLPKSFGMWAKAGWIPVDQGDTGGEAPDAAESTAEKTAASGRGAHPAAKANKDK